MEAISLLSRENEVHPQLAKLRGHLGDELAGAVQTDSSPVETSTSAQAPSASRITESPLCGAHILPSFPLVTRNSLSG